MKRILFFKDDLEPIIWDISEEEPFKKAVLELFIILDLNCRAYSDLKTDQKVCEECDGNRTLKLRTGVYTCPKCDGYSMTAVDAKRLKHQKELYDLAKEGDPKSAFLLLTERQEKEGERWKVYEVR